MYYIYFAKSIKSGKVYVGYTSKTPKERIEEHNRSGNAWTKANKPLKMVYFEKYNCLEDSKRRELFYKSGFGRRVKKILISELESAGVAQR